MPKNGQMRAISKSLVQWGMHTYWRFARGMTLGVRGVAIDSQGRVCLIRHTYLAGWHLPGGGVETGETAYQALERELWEEACIRISSQPVLHGVFFNRRVSRRDHVLVYVVRDFTITGTKIPDREIAEAGFFPLDDLPDDTAASTRRRLDEIASRRPLADTW